MSLADGKTMKMTATMTLNLKAEEVSKKVIKSARESMRDTVVAIWNGAIKGSPWKTGHNRRSLVGESSGFSPNVGADGIVEHIVDDSKIQGAIYSTSGYGGFLEGGTMKMAPRPHIRPSADREFTESKFVGRMKTHL